MVEASFNIFDLIVFGVVGLSALLSFFRGFVREFFSLGAWVGALVVTLYAFPHVTAWLSPHVEDDKDGIIVSGLASVGTFMFSLIIISIFTSMLMKLMKKGSDIGLLDNALGLGFGVLRGTLLVAIGYIIASVVMPKDGFEAKVEPAITAPYISKVAGFLQTIAPDYLNKLSGQDAKDDSSPATEEPETNDVAPVEEGSKGSYRWDSMDKLQEMIEERAKDTP